jgi:hypothetical protein
MAARWNLDDAFAIIRAMAPIVRRCNFSLALRGSVLLRGESDKDLDLCFLSDDIPQVCSPQRLLQEIAQGMREQIDHCDPPTGGSSYPRTFIWLRDGRHIDAQFWL